MIKQNWITATGETLSDESLENGVGLSLKTEEGLKRAIRKAFLEDSLCEEGLYFIDQQFSDDLITKKIKSEIV